LSKPELQQIASCHSDADCRKRVKYAARQQKWSNKSSSSSSSTPTTSAAYVAQAAGSGNSDLHAQVAQLSGTVNQLVEALSKKRKHDAAPMEEA
jgi:succinylarginine dihydrolase